MRELLRGNHRYVFTLIHKFQMPEMLCDRPDVVALTDEAHRSQYDTLALNMCAALPKALFLAFTGTPLIAGMISRLEYITPDNESMPKLRLFRTMGPIIRANGRRESLLAFFLLLHPRTLSE